MKTINTVYVLLMVLVIIGAFTLGSITTQPTKGPTYKVIVQGVKEIDGEPCVYEVWKGTYNSKTQKTTNWHIVYSKADWDCGQTK